MLSMFLKHCYRCFWNIDNINLSSSSLCFILFFANYLLYNSKTFITATTEAFDLKDFSLLFYKPKPSKQNILDFKQSHTSVKNESSKCCFSDCFIAHHLVRRDTFIVRHFPNIDSFLEGMGAVTHRVIKQHICLESHLLNRKSMKLRFF